MEVQKNSLTKLCSFYVSDWHLVTMLLPYINQKINEKAKIATILEEDIEKNIITLVERLNLKNKEQILNVNWKKQEKVGIKNEIRINELEENEELIILVNGRKEFIEKNNIKLERYFNTHLIKNNIKIINCYEVIEFNGSIQEILDYHDKMLNTCGEKEIKEVFMDYEKSNNQEEKAVV